MDPAVWGPHYWGMLHTVAVSYPDHPDAIQRKVCYRFVNNLPSLMPPGESSSSFSRLLKEYPVAPYLDRKEDFVRWTNMIHNKVNKHLGRRETSLEQMMSEHMNRYASRPLFVSREKCNRILVTTAGWLSVVLLMAAVVIEK
jgi:hypothetical protein